MIFDFSLFFNKQIGAVVRGDFHLRSIAKLKQHLTGKDLEDLEVVTSRLVCLHSGGCFIKDSNKSGD